MGSTMVLHRFLLVTLATLLVGTTSAVVTKETKLSLLDHDAVSARDDTRLGRSLRLAETFDGKDGVNGGEHSIVVEERANPVSSVLSKISDKVPLWMKTAWWLERRKPAEYVQKKLGMEGLTGAELKDHKNYQRLVNYIDDLEGNEIWTQVRRGYTTYKKWNDGGLNHGAVYVKGMSFDQINAQLSSIKQTESYRVYKRFAIAFDDHILSLFGSGYNRPTKFFDENATPIEIFARAEIWAERRIDPQYVREFLGMMHVKHNPALKDMYYKYYWELLQKTKAN